MKVNSDLTSDNNIKRKQRRYFAWELIVRFVQKIELAINGILIKRPDGSLRVCHIIEKELCLKRNLLQVWVSDAVCMKD